MGKYSSLLYAQPSFAEGMARLWDFGNFLNEYNASPSGEIADWIALASDFAAVNEDVRGAFERYIASMPQEQRLKLL
ncbi:MAG: hypothetical protein ACHQNE_01630 [Candidatus Kapaibacterium sp.]